MKNMHWKLFVKLVVCSYARLFKLTLSSSSRIVIFIAILVNACSAAELLGSKTYSLFSIVLNLSINKGSIQEFTFSILVFKPFLNRVDPTNRIFSPANKEKKSLKRERSSSSNVMFEVMHWQQSITCRSSK